MQTGKSVFGNLEDPRLPRWVTYCKSITSSVSLTSRCLAYSYFNNALGKIDGGNRSGKWHKIGHHVRLRGCGYRRADDGLHEYLSEGLFGYSTT